MFLFSPKSSKNVYLCLLNDNNAQLNLMHSIELINWHGNTYANQLIAIDFTTDSVITSNCSYLAKKYNVDILKPEEFDILNYGDINGADYNKRNS